jgi:soluble lytic murein transglycosylase-like protein
MDISTDLADLSQRISQITGTPTQVPGLSSLGADAAVDPNSASFAALVQAAIDGQSDAPVNPEFSAFNQQPDSVAPNAPSMVPPAEIDRLVQTNAATFGVDPNLVKAIIANESGFNANATSSVGAQGLMQLMPGTASGLGVSNSYDAAQNVWGGTKYIKGLLDRFGGDMKRAVAAYNAGPGAVEKYGGVPPYAETQNYVQNVLSSYNKYSAQNPSAMPTATTEAP